MGALESVRVEVLDATGGIYACDECAESWFVATPPSGDPRGQGWWLCPNGRNDDTADAATDDYRYPVTL